MQDVRTKAATKLVHAERMIAAKTTEIKRLVTSLSFWQRRAAYYAKRAVLTDTEITAEREQRVTRAKARPPRRGIRL